MSADKPSFFDIRNRILEWPGLSLSAKTIWISLCQYSWTDGSCYHSRQTLAENHGMHIDTVKSARRELSEKGLIKVFKRPLPLTAVTFPFVKFQAIEQRDKNVVRLENQIGDKTTLSSVNNNNDLQSNRGNLSPIIGDKTTLLIGDKTTPIKENSLKENLKEEDDTTNVVSCQTCHPNDKSDTKAIANKPQSTLTKKQKSELHHKSRQNQLSEIESNIQQYKDEYPAIDVDLQFKKMKLWLDSHPKGKVRKNIHRTWINWLLRAHSNYNVAQTGKLTKNKREFDPEEYKRYVTNTNT